MWVNEGLEILERLFPKLVLKVNHGNGDKRTMEQLSKLTHCDVSTDAQLRRSADVLGLWVDGDGNVSHR